MVELTGTLGAATGPFVLTPGPAEPSILSLTSPLVRQFYRHVQQMLWSCHTWQRKLQPPQVKGQRMPNNIIDMLSGIKQH